MSNIIVDYGSIENAIPTVNSLSADCEGLKGKVDGIASDIEALGANHDDCFGSSVGVLDMFSGFITKMGSEYEAVASVANTALGAFNNAEGKITADTDKIADLKWLLVYLGMDSEACNKLDFDKINTGDADISKYEAYYKDTNADLSSSINSEIADMLLIEDGKGGYKVLTRKEIEEYIKEQSKAETTSSAETTTGNDYSSSSSSSSSSGNTGATSSSSSSSSGSKPSSSSDNSDGTTQPRTDEDNKPSDNKPDENKPDENKPDESKPDENKPDESKPDESKPDESKPDESKPDENKPDDQTAQDQSGQQQQQPVTTTTTAVAGSPEVSSQAVSAPASNVSNIGIGNARPEVASTTAPDNQGPAATPAPENTNTNDTNTNNTTNTIDSSNSSSNSGTTRHTTTIPSTTPSTKTTNNSGGSATKFVFPALGAVAAAGAAGVGAKMYLDKKNEDEDGDEIEEYNDYDLNDEEYSTEDDYNPNSSIQAPDSSWSLDNNIEENKY